MHKKYCFIGSLLLINIAAIDSVVFLKNKIPSDFSATNWILNFNTDNLPLNAMILITFIVLAGNFLPSVHALYEIMVMASSILLFLTYTLLITAYLKMKFTRKEKTVFEIPWEKTGALISSAFVPILCFVNIIVHIVSIPSDYKLIPYELENRQSHSFIYYRISTL